MKRLLFLALIILPAICRGGHAAGLDICYTHIAGNTYRISLTIYGNCHDQPNNNYPSFFTGNPQILIIDSTTKSNWKTIGLDLITDSTRDVSPYCTRYLDSTNCKNPLYTYQGYTRFVYSDTVTLPYKSAKWIFRFTSAMQSGCSGRLGRPAVNNLVGGNGTNVVLEAMLNNSVINNSSPAYSSSLFTAYCVNVPSSYYQLARDPDNDSLAFELVAPLREINGCGGTQALPNATGFNPLGTIANGFSFDKRNGTMIFTSDVIQVSAVATKIYEYRNGVLIGSTMREKIFKVLSTCNNIPPSGRVDTSALLLQGAKWCGIDSIIACPGNVISFKIPVTDLNGDTIKASVIGIPSGSSITVANNNSKNPSIQFTWNTAGVSSGTYTFLGAYQDNGCPLKSEGLVTYTIIINDGGSITPAVMSQTHCIYKAAVQYDVQTVFYPYTLTVMQGTSLINTVTGNNAGVIADSLYPGVYTLHVTSPGAPCPKETTFEVKDDGTYPFSPSALSPITYCRNADAVALKAKIDSASLPGTVLRWYDENLNFLSGDAPVPSTVSGGVYKFYVREQYKNCESDMDTVTVTIDQQACNYDITIHNAITPNGDGKNDKWVIDNLDYYPNVSVQIFDKLGDKVYEKANYRNDWDGGNLPSGVYYYLIRLNGTNKTSGTENFTGYLLIKR